MGWEVKIDMSGQSNGCLRVCNVKMKKNLPGQKWGASPRMYGLRGCSIDGFENFFRGIWGTHQSNCCGHIFANIN